MIGKMLRKFNLRKLRSCKKINQDEVDKYHINLEASKQVTAESNDNNVVIYPDGSTATVQKDGMTRLESNI